MKGKSDSLVSEFFEKIAAITNSLASLGAMRCMMPGRRARAGWHGWMPASPIHNGFYGKLTPIHLRKR